MAGIVPTKSGLFASAWLKKKVAVGEEVLVPKQPSFSIPNPKKAKFTKEVSNLGTHE